MCKCTILHYAVAGSTLSIVKKLVKNGANINKTDEFHLTPGDLAIIYQKTSIEEFLQSELSQSLK